MKKTLMIAVVLILATVSNAQNIYSTKDGQISFSSQKSVESIDAVNSEVASFLNIQSGDLVFSALLKGFHFQRALMEEHFNENYVESEKFPKSTFKGKITNATAVNFTKDGSYPVKVEGDLTLHGVTKKVSAPGTVVVKGGVIQASSKFNIKLKDYDVKIPSLVADKLSEDVDVKVDCKYEIKK
jgi:hypothetical protein